jgi:hypothetical protein
LFRVVDAALVRAATHASSIEFPPWPDLTEVTDEHLLQWREWLRQVWACESFTAAVEVASPALARHVEQVCDDHRPQSRQVRRVVMSVMRYLVRARSRATPFGLFAGVAPARFGPRLAVSYGKQHQAIARIDTEWLTSVIERLEASDELRHRLQVVLNDVAFVRDGRLVVGCQRQVGASGGSTVAEVSVRLTKAVEIVTRLAAAPIRVGDLVDKLTAEFPETRTAMIEDMVAELVARHMLVSSLRPPMTVTDPLKHVIEHVTAIGADALPPVADLVTELRDIQIDLSRHGRTSSPARQRDLRTAVVERMAKISASDRPVTIDLRLDCELVLPHTIVREVEAAAHTLVRLAPHPTGMAAWKDYHRRFLERYGMAAMVPVAAVLNADTGLGFPSGYRDAQVTPPPVSGLSERDVLLLALAQKATIERTTEIVLDEDAIRRLAVGDIATVQPHTELRVRLHAATPSAVDRGEFELVVAGVSRAAGTTTGRFVDLLDHDDRERMAAAYARLPTVTEDAITAQVSCPTLSPRAENIARSPALLPHVVSLAEYHPFGGELVRLDDLAVTADAQRFYLMSVSRKCKHSALFVTCG